MDPAGIREILLVRHYIENQHQIEALARDLPFKVRVQSHYAGIPWLPFFPPLPQRVSRASEGYAGYLQHDVLILAGVDLESGSERDVQHIRSACERGLPLLLWSGPSGGGCSYRLWHDLASVLPAQVPAGEPAECEGEAVAAADHVLLRALPRAFGKIKKLHRLVPAPDAQVLLTVNGRPALVVSERHGGRQMICAVAEAEGVGWDGFESRGFYGHPFYPDLVRQILSWLMGVEPPLWFESLEVAGNPQTEIPDRLEFRVTVRQRGVQEGAALRCRFHAVDEARLMAGGDAVRTEVLAEETRPIRAVEQTEACACINPRPFASSGLCECELTLEMDKPPSTQVPKSFAMAAPPRWSHWKSKAVARRCFRLRFADRRAARIQPDWSGVLREAGTWSVKVAHPLPATCRMTIHDGKGIKVGEVDGGNPAQEQVLRWTVPPLQEGEYRARLTVAPAAGSREEWSILLRAATLPDPRRRFVMVGHLAWSGAGEIELNERIRAYREDFGLNAFSIGGLKAAETLASSAKRRPDWPALVRRLPWVEAAIAAQDANLWTDFDLPLIVLATHGASTAYQPTQPCVHHPDYEKTAREKLAPLLRFQAGRAGLVSTEIIDEPHLYPSNVCRCDICRRLYRERYGEELPAWEELRGDRTARRWRFFEWLTDYTTRAFAATMTIKRETAPQLRLHNVAIDRLFSSDFMFNAIHRWAAHGDELYMACYPWSYLSWRGGAQAPHSQTHWIAAWIRGLAGHYGIPWGVFMELWEHDAPNRWLPPFWSVGQFYALLAAGVERLDTFLVSFEYEIFGISDVRLREFGAEVLKIRPFFALLAGSRRPRGRLAFLNPWCQWVMDPQPHELPPDHEGYGYYRRYAIPFDRLYPNENRRMIAFELFHRAFPDLEQVEENLLCEAPLDYHTIAVCDCRFLMRRTLDKLAEFVENGGALVLDCEPDRDESGAPTDFYRRLTRRAPTHSGAIAPGLGYRIHPCGKGRVVRFTESLQRAYADTLESGREGVVQRIEAAVARVLRLTGELPRWESSCGEIDAGVRSIEGSALVPVANLDAAARSGRVILRDLSFVPELAVNLTTGEFLDLWVGQNETRFDVALESYHGALIALFAGQPKKLTVAVAARDLQPGDRLGYEIRLQGRDDHPLAGTFPVQVEICDPQGARHPRLGGPLLAVQGTVCFEGRLPVNAAVGEWTLRAYDPVIGLAGQAPFRVLAR